MGRINFYLSTIIFFANSTFSLADEPCSYCGGWRPWAAGGVNFTSKELLSIDESTIQLPNCTKTPFKITDEKIDERNLSDRDFPKPVIARLKLMGGTSCKGTSKSFNAGTIIKLRVDPRFQFNSEELEVSIEDVNNKSNSIFWFLIRAHHNPCDEGGKQGEMICLAIINNGVSYEMLEDYSLPISSGVANVVPKFER